MVCLSVSMYYVLFRPTRPITHLSAWRCNIWRIWNLLNFVFRMLFLKHFWTFSTFIINGSKCTAINWTFSTCIIRTNFITLFHGAFLRYQPGPIFPSWSEAPLILAPIAWLRTGRRWQTPWQYGFVPRHRSSTYGRRTFSVAAPTVWNSFPDSLRYPEYYYRQLRVLVQNVFTARRCA